MAEKKKGRKRKEGFTPRGEDFEEKPSKDEYKVAKWMRNNVPIKKTKFVHHNVEYFTGRRAVDALMESKWAQGDEPFFKTRDHCVDYLHTMLEHKFFHRARKVPISDQELKAKKKEKKKDDSESTDEKEKKDSKKDKDKATDAESSVVETKPEQAQPEKEKRKKKIRLEMHNDQQFVDSLDAYVWIYDPIPFHYWIIGTFFVLGAIGLCLFPLWPPSVRNGVHYLCVAAAGFLVSIILLAVLRFIIFSLIWVCTMGKHHLWILPNLTEDVGFFESFVPLYTYKYQGETSKDKSKKKKKAKDSDAEEESDKEEKEKISNDNPTAEEVPLLKEEVEEVKEKHSESESESSQKSSTGKDFEMVEQEDLESS